MHVGYFKVYRPCFIAKVREIFVLMIIQFHRNESSWTFCSLGANVPRNESFTGAKVLSMDFSLPGTKVQSNEKA